jgi:hypothetical protein
MTEAVAGMSKLNRRLDAVGSTEGRRQLLGELGLTAVGYSKEEAPVKTSNLRRTIRLGTVTDTEVRILAGGTGGVGYARAVHEGSRPHEIRPRRRKVLRWARGGSPRRLTGSPRTGNGEFLYARVVHHPGNKPNRFLVRGIMRALGEGGLARKLIHAWNDAA